MSDHLISSILPFLPLQLHLLQVAGGDTVQARSQRLHFIRGQLLTAGSVPGRELDQIHRVSSPKELRHQNYRQHPNDSAASRDLSEVINHLTVESLPPEPLNGSGMSSNYQCRAHINASF